jgi:hypothetical protein
MARGINKCPNCGATVSQFAAGCAICGEDLTAARQRREQRREALPSVELPGWLSEISGTDALLGALLMICAIGFPVVGGPIAGLFAFFAHQRGDVAQRNLALAALVVAVILILLFSFVPESVDWWGWINFSGPFPSN